MTDILLTVQVEALFQAKQQVAAIRLGNAAKKRKMNVIDVQRATAIGVQARGLK